MTRQLSATSLRLTGWLAATCVAGARLSAQTPSDFATRLDVYLAPFVETANFTGVVHVSRRGRLLFEKAYGLAHPGYGLSNRPDTRFHIASISKAFTAAAILILEDRGLLTTADPVSRLLPDYPRGDAIRLEHLLVHSSGIPHVEDFPELARHYKPYTAADVVAVFRDLPLDFEPGARFRYTNAEYNLLALIIERVAGASFGEVLRDVVFGPLRLDATVHDGDARQVIPNLASGTEPAGLRDVRYLPYHAWSTKVGSGSIVSTAEDLCRFAEALFGGRLLQPASQAKLREARGVFPYGWADRERGGRKVKGVGGRSPGFITSLEYFLDDGTCIAILTNSYSSVGQVIAPDVSTLAAGGHVPPPQIAHRIPEPGELASYSGRYQLPENYFVPGARLTIHNRGAYLEAEWEIGLTSVIYPTGPDRFVDRTNWAMVQFTRTAGGHVDGFRYLLFNDFVARRVW
jgi:CubicO group peptidase (beta-lactamase class C family)